MVKGNESSKEKPGKTLAVFLPLECKLTEAEVRDSSKRLAEALNQRDAAKAKKSAFLTQISADTKALEASVSKFQSMVSSEKEYRTVECEARYFFGRNGGEKEIHRKDTGELVKIEAVSEQERQTAFA
jgi:hypothetical protein